MIADSCKGFHELSTEDLRLLHAPKEGLGLPLAFVFTGQGAQWPGTGRQLVENYPTVQSLSGENGCYAYKVVESTLSEDRW